MVDNAFTVLRRGFESAFANWPLLLVRFCEGLLIVGVVIAGVAGSLLALGLSLDFSGVEKWAEHPEQAAEWLLANVGLFVAFMIVLALIGGVAFLIHAYVQAGVTATFVRFERLPQRWSWREGWNRFSLGSVIESAARYGWRVFLIYNIVWGVAGLVILIPLAVLLAVVLAIGEAATAIVLTCLGLVVIVLLSIIVGIVAGAWSQVAITVALAVDAGSVESSSRAGDVIRARLGSVVLVMVAIFAVSLGLSSLMSTMNLAFMAGKQAPGGEYWVVPFEIVLAFVNAAATSLVGLWMAASFAVIVLDACAPDNGGSVGS